MPLASGDAGVNVAWFTTPWYSTIPAAAAPLDVTVSLTVVLLMVDAFIGSLNETDTGVVVATFVARFGGVVDTTVGAVVSATAAVVKLDVNCEPNALPPTSLTPVVTVTV